jgi:hypothetical protein
MEDRVRELEGNIEQAEAAIAELEAALQKFVSAEESQRQAEKLGNNKSLHAALIEEWESLEAALAESE